MSANWTQEQVLSLAPDASSAKNGRVLANLSKWDNLGCNEKAIWGEFKGSGKKPYRTQIDLSEPAFKCTCPSRKFPCKHALGLFLLFSMEKAAFTRKEAPDWVSDWLDSRTKRQEKKAEKAQKASTEIDTKTQAKRAQKRLDKVSAGIEDLEVWLRDLVRQGLATVQGKPLSFWDNVAARLVDAQAGGLARIIKSMGSIPYSGVGWQERLLGELGKVYLLIEGFKRIDTLPKDVQADIRTQIGWTQTKEELSQKSGIKDTWLILGQQTEEEDRLKVQRNWLWGKDSQHWALILNFAHHTQPIDISLIPGNSVDGELVFFESAYQLRAIVKHKEENIEGNTKENFNSVSMIPGYKSIEQVMEKYAQALAQNPWIEIIPVGLNNVFPVKENINKNGTSGEEKYFIQDKDNYQIPIKPKFQKYWQLLALCGGYPIDIFGEWNGEYFLPLSVVVGSDFFIL